MIDYEEMDRAAEHDKPVRGETTKQAIFRIADRALALTQQKQLSAEHYRLVDNDTAFFRRYFMLKNRQWRFAFMRLKAKHNLSDQQLQFFYFTGNLKLRNDEMKITADAFVAVIGWTFITLLTAVYAAQAYTLVTGLPFSWGLAKGCAYIAVAAALTTASYHSIYIKPWQMARVLKQP